MLKTLFRTNKVSKELEIASFTIFFVRTGDYLEDLISLSSLGIEQIRASAQVICSLATSRPLVSIEPDASVEFLYLRYLQSTRLLSHELGAPIFKAGNLSLILAMDTVNPTLRKLRSEVGHPEISQVVYVTNGTSLAHWLRTFPGPDVPMKLDGPAHGSVHELRIRYEVNTGNIVDRCFV